MPKTERFQSCQGENQRSDQAFIQRDASSSRGRIHDFATHRPTYEYQLGRDKEKNIMTKAQAIDEQIKWNRNDKAAKNEIINHRGGRTGGEIPLGYQEGLRGGGKLSEGNWNTLRNSLNTIRDAFNANDSESSINAKLSNLKNKVVEYQRQTDDSDNYTWLSKIEEHLPENAKTSSFL